jgi:hypothetical protein
MIELPLLFLACAMIVSGVIIRAMDIRSKRLSATVINALGSIIASSLIATFAIAFLLRLAASGRPANEKVECCGMMEGGFVLFFLWMAVYSVSYVATSILVAALQKRRRTRAA